jgi:hypothetical protein
MFADLLAFLVATFLLGPLQAEVTSRLEATQAGRQVVAQVTRCAADAAPRLVERAAAEPVWAVATALRAWAGLVAPEAVLRDAAPSCPAAMDAARPFLAEGAARS